MDNKDKKEEDEHDFDFSVLWQDIEESSFAQFLPWINLIIGLITFLVLLTK